MTHPHDSHHLWTQPESSPEPHDTLNRVRYSDVEEEPYELHGFSD